MQASPAASNAVVPVTQGNFDAEVLKPEFPVLVEFWAPWCIYCKKLAPVYASLAIKWAGKVKFTSVNVDEETQLSERFAIMSLPTLKAFCSGREVGESVGFLGADPLEASVRMMSDHAQECLATSEPVQHSHL